MNSYENTFCNLYVQLAKHIWPRVFSFVASSFESISSGSEALLLLFMAWCWGGLGITVRILTTTRFSQDFIDCSTIVYVLLLMCSLGLYRLCLLSCLFNNCTWGYIDSALVLFAVRARRQGHTGPQEGTL